MQLKLNMKCPLCGAEGSLKVYKYQEDHMKQMAELSGQCIKCPMEFEYIVKSIDNMIKLRDLVYEDS
ncbi:MAG: hypothetical protein JXA22_05675 [Candidatus Thermoplasmatota archaeon]|nr:hypothetical protein [Candidatus Thermoplasmatota archaeon]